MCTSDTLPLKECVSVVLQNAQECYRENEYISVCSHRAGDYVCSTSICSVNVASVAYVVLPVTL